MAGCSCPFQQASPKCSLQIGWPAVLRQQVAKRLVRKLLEGLHRVVAKQVQSLPCLFVEMDALAGHRIASGGSPALRRPTIPKRLLLLVLLTIVPALLLSVAVLQRLAQSGTLLKREQLILTGKPYRPATPWMESCGSSLPSRGYYRCLRRLPLATSPLFVGRLSAPFKT